MQLSLILHLEGSDIFAPVYLEDRDIVDDLKALAAAQLDIPIHLQEILFNGKILSGNAELKSVGLTDNDVIVVKTHTQAPHTHTQGPTNTHTHGQQTHTQQGTTTNIANIDFSGYFFNINI
eukprot:GHVR01105833.1.p1 GENE.GHVR01105833.1~~GHVR01105833.1.p1  ORF type:complete len:121 (-),score=54.84 GHVR01105833.1:43-405(-)